MAFFPTSPANNATTIVNGITYIYNTSLQAWKIVPGGADFTDSTARATANAAFAAANTGSSSTTSTKKIAAGYSLVFGG
jgi:hypothetical protein